MATTTDSRPPSLLARLAMGSLLNVVGTTHFVAPAKFDAIVPEELPAPRFWTYASGVAEVGLGSALLLRPSRRVGWLVVALLVAIFPANINQAVRQVDIPGTPSPPRWALWARLPLQAVMIWAALAATRPPVAPTAR